MEITRNVRELDFPSVVSFVPTTTKREARCGESGTRIDVINGVTIRSH